MNDDGKISFRDFKRSNLKEILFTVAAEEDINKVREYFSYEHFYVLYCRFGSWTPITTSSLIKKILVGMRGMRSPGKQSTAFSIRSLANSNQVTRTK